MFIAIIFLWLGCLIAFLGSKQQKFLKKPLNKQVSLFVFVVCLLASWLFFSNVYSGVTAALLILSFVMVMWLIIIFVQGHFSIKLLPFMLYGSAISLAFIQLGGL